MKILYLSSSPKMSLTDRCGYCTHIAELIKALEQMGNTVLPLIAGSDAQQNGNSSLINKIRAYLPGNVAEQMRILYDIYFDFKYYSIADRTFLSFSPDVIYERYEAFHRSGIKLKRKYEVPIMLEVNAPLSERDLHYGHRKRKFAHIIEKRTLQWADAIIVVSEFLKKYLMESGISESRIHIIPNAVDTDKFKPDIKGDSVRKKFHIQNKIVIGFVGGIERRHRINDLFAILENLLGKNKQIHLLIVGDGSNKKEYEAYVIKNSISDYVTFAGSVNYEDVPQYIAAMNIAVIPSTGIYCSPIKLFEYLAMGKAVVAPRLNNVEQIVTHEENAYLFDPGDLSALLDSLLVLCENETLRSQIGSNARQIVLANHTWKRNAERVMEVYSSF